MTKKKARKATARAPSKSVEGLNREQWLNRANRLIVPMFDKIGYPLSGKKLRISCGFPGGRGSKKFVGQCWNPKASGDGTTELFVSPIIDDPFTVLSILFHEDVHAAVGTEEGHKGKFKACFYEIGMTGKPTQCKAGELLAEKIRGLIKRLPPYPHAALDFKQKPTKTQKTKLLKASCPKCGYIVRVSEKCVNEVGAPHCPNHGEMIIEGMGE